MHTEGTFEHWSKAKWIEGTLLLAVAPFLFLPHRSLAATSIALILVAAFWLWPVIFLRSPLIPAIPYNVVLLLFCVTVFIGILVTADPEYTLSKATGIILGLSVWRYISIYIQRRDQFRWLVAGYIFLGFSMTVVGFLNANWLAKATLRMPYLLDLLQSNLNSYFLLGSVGSAIDIHPNQLAGLITLYLPLLIALLISREVRSRKIVFMIVTAVTFLAALALLVTQSRSGWLGMIGGLFALVFVWSLLLPPSLKRNTIWGTMVFFLLVGLIILVQVGPARITELWLDPPRDTIIGTFSTLKSRQEVWSWALTAVRDFPYTGTGLGTFRVVARRLYPIDVPSAFDFAHAHNVFLQMALDIGIPGLVSYVALLLLSVVLAWKVARSDLQLRPLGVGILASLWAFHVYGLADTSALGSKPALLFWIIIAMLGVANNFKKSYA
ncbi:MAG: O-antigen ligase family protein [Candidatus Promineifilaceae bacterium]|nr:O-antigen ligase family protein [Candidatus Promineifilaceae bacterium]